MFKLRIKTIIFAVLLSFSPAQDLIGTGQVTQAISKEGMIFEDLEEKKNGSQDLEPPDELLQFTAGRHVLGFKKGEVLFASGDHALRIEFIDALPVSPVEEERSMGLENGSLAAQPLSKVIYRNLWNGVTLAYEKHAFGVVKSTYHFQPVGIGEANPVGKIRIRYSVPVKIDENGSLVFSFPTGEMKESPPVAWQEIHEKRVPVDVKFHLIGEQEVGFMVGSFNPRYPLVIDPVLSWNTFLGSSSEDVGRGIAVDSNGNVYVMGYSLTTWGSPVRPFAGNYDAFVTKLNGSGALQWSTFLGSSSEDQGRGIAVDSSGNVYVTGYSLATWGSSVLPYSGTYDAFVAKLNGNGALQWNTFLGSLSEDQGRGIAVDSNGNVYVTGYSLATWGSPVRPFAGTYDAFVTKLNGSGALQWSTFLGSSSADYSSGIAVDVGGNSYVTGHSYASWGSPVRPYSGTYDAFVTKLNGSGALQWNTFLGSSSIDYGYSIAEDSSGNIYVTGHSDASWGLPVRPFDSYDAFVAKLNGSGVLQWNTFLGSSSDDNGVGIAVDVGGNVYVTGWSNASWGSPDPPFASGYDAFAAKLNGNGALQWNTFLGWSADDFGFGIAVDASQNVYVAGYSGATWGLPVRPYSGTNDAFVAKIGPSATITVTSPNGGENWIVGSSHAITWTTTGTVGNIKLEYSTEGGSTYAPVIALTPNTGTYAWTVPNTPSTTCIVRASDAATEALNDVSDAAFSIVVSSMIGLSRNALFFGSAGATPATGAQTVLVSNSSGGALGWTASKNKAWLGVSPVSGTGDAVLTVTVNPSGLARGTYTGQVTITVPGATNSPLSVSVTLKVYSASGTSAPFGSFDTPISGATVRGSIPVTGWALDDIEVIKVEIRRAPVTGDPPGAIGADGLVWIGDATFVEGARPDVETAWPKTPLNTRAGWGYMLLTYGLPNHGNGTFVLHAVALDRDGHRSELATKTSVSDNAHNTKPFGAIDTPGPGATVSGSSYVNFGWVLTPPPAMIPVNGSTIWLWIDSIQVGHPTYNNYRSDIHDAYPGYLNADGAAGFYYIDTTAFADGMHMIGWSATDDRGQEEGMGSRFFWVFNGSSGTGVAGLGAPIISVLTSGPDNTAKANAPNGGLLSGQASGVPASTCLGSLADLAGMAADGLSPIYIRRGFRDAGTYEVMNPDALGVRNLAIEEVERVVMALDSPADLPADGRALREKLASDRGSVDLTGPVSWSGYLIVGSELRPLPIGSTLDARGGVFYWQPGPGFLGPYQFVFVDGKDGKKKFVTLNVRPKGFLQRR